jgi:ferredoxin--NADP+ reductase
MLNSSFRKEGDPVKNGLSNKLNAVVLQKQELSPQYMILRVTTEDCPLPAFTPGQFAVLGMLAEAPRCTLAPDEPYPPAQGELIRRAYSVASSSRIDEYMDFYIGLVTSGNLTPRLFSLNLGDRLWLSPKVAGMFTLDQVPTDKNAILIATGTGLAPYISFLRSHINDHREIKMAVMHGAAYPWDLGYYSELKFIESAFPNFYYMPTLLKADSAWHGLRGYIETHLESGLLQKNSGIELDPEKTHFYLCGNPKMVDSVVAVLEKNNFKKHTKKFTGSVHIEEY